MKKKLPSEQVRDFIDFLKACQSEYKTCVAEEWKYDRRQQDYLHDLEFANNYDDRCKLATAIHAERVERRNYKDRKQMVEEISKFCSDKQFMERLVRLLDRQRQREEYLSGNRHYNRRGGELNDSC